ncbi:MAG: hypothetical protein IKA09_09065 [Lachnospiraceae bacterium]|nr:hypothetical protein [Lachnospiraceae bacterium]
MQQYLTYEEFGAIGDGIHDDMPAIVKAHREANRQNIPVKGTSGACYYISPKNATAEVCTDTDWTGAKFIIDDRNCEDLSSVLFLVSSGEQNLSLDIRQLERGQITLENPHNCELYVSVKNENHRDYIRMGLNRNNGWPRRDNFILQADGTMPSPVAFDFEEVTSVEARPVEKTTIHLTGGQFTTIANPRNCTFTPYTSTRRNILIRRSNVEVSGLSHFIEDEGTFGTAYDGFIHIMDCAHITVHDCLFTAHYIYYCTGSAGKPVAMGSYDLVCDNAVDVRFINCRQTTDIQDKRYWGLFCSNFCRDLLFENCIFSRFDTHMGVTNCTIRGCTFGHQAMKIIGNGNFLIEDTRVVALRFIELRSDYGSSFRGDLTIRNCSWRPTGSERRIIEAFNAGRHDFGYPCYLFEHLTIDGFMVETYVNPEPLSIFADYMHSNAYYHLLDTPQDYLPIPPETVTVSRLSIADSIQLCINPQLMTKTQFTVL